MVVILVGADGTGKSTCFAMLKKLFPYARFIKESHTKSEFEKLHNVERLIEHTRSSELIIYDRTVLLDDLVYSKIIDGKRSEFEDTAYVSYLRKCLIINFTCTARVLEERLLERGDEFITPGQIENIVRSYKDVYQKYNLFGNVFTIDTTSRDPARVAGLAEALIRCRASKLAEIVPKETLEVTRDNAYHMCLAQLVLKDPAYASFYRRMSEEGKFVLLDNGAAEGEELSLEEVLKAAELVNAAEIILPDVLFEGKTSFEKSISAYFNLLEYKDEKGIRLMFVPQGRSFSEWYNYAMLAFKYEGIDDIGVPKHLSITFADKEARFTAVHALDKEIRARECYDKRIHLLGCNESPKELKVLMKASPFIRGCDTVAPYLFTKYERAKSDECQTDCDSFARASDMSADMLEDPYLDMFWLGKKEFELSAGVMNNSEDRLWR